MRTRIISIFLAVVMLAGGMYATTQNVSAATIPIQNGGFESAISSGWTAVTPSGNAKVQQYITYYESFNSPPAYTITRQSGNRFALLTPNTMGQYTRIYQTFTVGAGDSISGYACIGSEDYLPYNDDAAVVIRALPYDPNNPDVNNDIATLFSASSGALGGIRSSGWIPWSYTFANAGTYTLEGRVRNMGDSIRPSVLGMDSTVSPSAFAGTYSLSVPIVGSGSVTLSSPSTVITSTAAFTYPSVTPVTLTATPSPGWVFNGWTGCVLDSNPNITVNVDSYKTVCAAFAQVNNPTTTQLTADPQLSRVGQNVTFTARVTGITGARAPTGTVNFYDGPNLLASGVPLGVQAAYSTTVFSTASLTAGTHEIKAVYQGDPNSNFYAAGSQGTLTYSVTSGPSTTALTASPEGPQTYGTPLTFTATVSPGTPGTTPTGTVTFIVGGGYLTSPAIPMVNGVASFTTQLVPAGSNNITGTYSGDATNQSSTGTMYYQVTPTTTTTLSTGSPSVSVFGQPVTFTANVNGVPGALHPSGTVSFYDGINLLGNANLTNGQTAFTTAVLSVGSHSITAVYGSDNNYLSSTSNEVAQTVLKASTTTAVTSSINPSSYNQTVTFTATISVVSPGAGIPTGTVTFYDGTAAIGTAAMNNNQATLITSTLSPGAHSISAVYNEDGNFNGSNSPVITQNVNPAVTALSVTPVTGSYGGTVTLSATLSSNNTGLSGKTIIFTLNGVNAGTAITDASGAASLPGISLNGTNTGTYPAAVSVSFAGDTNYLSSSGTAGLSVGQAQTTSSVTTSANPAIYGQPVTFTASVNSTGGNPSGSIQFQIDGINAGNPVILSNQSATSEEISSLSTGNHTISAIYSGDANFSTSTGTLSQTVNKATATAIITSSGSPSVYNQTVTFTAKVSGVTGGAMPSGTVTFTDGGNNPGTAQLDANGQATWAISTLSAGTHTITVAYGGDTNYNSTSANATQVVNRADSAVGVTTSLSPSVYGEPVQFTATVSGPGSTPTGTLQFMVDDAASGSPMTLTNGSASISISSMSRGSHTVTANYSGDTNYNGSSGSTAQTVNKANTTTSVSSSAADSVYGQSVTFTAQVTAAAPGAGTPSGSVTFFDGGQLFGVGVPVNGTATLEISSLSAGSHEITATYNGNDNFLTSTSAPISQEVANKPDTTTTITSPLTAAVYGQPVSFTANVIPSAATGTVQFTVDGTNKGTPVNVSNGSAAITISDLTVGTHSVKAVYSGDTNYASSTSEAINQVVSQGNISISLTSNPNPANAGATVTLSTAVASVAPASGTPTGTVAFFDGTNSLGTATLNSGTAILATSFSTTGTHVITARYSGDANFAANQATLNQIVNTTQSSMNLYVDKMMINWKNWSNGNGNGGGCGGYNNWDWYSMWWNHWSQGNWHDNYGCSNDNDCDWKWDKNRGGDYDNNNEFNLFQAWGRIQLPNNVSVSDLKSAATITLTIRNSSRSETQTLKVQSTGYGSFWQHNSNDKNPSDGIDNTYIKFWWSPNWSHLNGWAGFHIKGIFRLADQTIGRDTKPAEATLTISFPLKNGNSSISDSQTVSFKVNTNQNLWSYHNHNFGSFACGLEDED